MSPAELITDPAALRAALRQLRALSRLQLVIHSGGTITRCPLRRAGRNALLTGSLAIDFTELDPETVIWRSGLLAAGGTLGDDSLALADALIRAIKAESFNEKIVYLLPLLGSNLAAARMPLRDSLGIGIATNHNFADADFSESTGLQGDGSTKRLDLGFTAAALGATSNGGIGYWETNAAGATTGFAACNARSPNQIYGVRIGTGSEAGWWGDANSPATTAVTVSDAHYYVQRSSATSRTLYRDAVSIATDTDAGVLVTEIASANVNLMGDTVSPAYYSGRCGVAYATDGTLTAGEITALHTLLSTYLITPTGR